MKNGIYKSPTAYVITYSEKINTFPLRTKTCKEAHFTTPIQHCTGESSHCNKVGRHSGEESEGQENCVFIDDITVYRENPEVSSKQLLELTRL